jgi:hypothetical protein
MNNLQFVEHYGHKFSGLTFYNCIFDEKNEKYDSTKPHKHKVVQSWIACRGSDVRDGVCYEQECGRIICGCQMKDFDKENP